VGTLLAIESSTPRASLALLTDGEVRYEGGFESDRNHNSLLFAPLQAALAAAAPGGIDEVVVGTGPGSYSGTRVGIAAGQGVAMVHDCPAVGLSSLLAAGVESGIAIGDARRGSAWWARLGEGLPEPALVPDAELAAKLEGAPRVFAFESVARLGLPDSIEVRPLVPTAAALARAWLALPEETRQRLRAEPPQPAYLRPPHITEAKKGHPLLRER